jgi:hypothetical protein
MKRNEKTWLDEAVSPIRQKIYREGGQAPRHWIVGLACAACGILPTLVMLRLAWHPTAPTPVFGTGLRFQPTLIETGVPITLILCVTLITRWCGWGCRRLSILVTVVLAAVTQIAVYGWLAAPVIDQRAMRHWFEWHTGYAILLTLAVILVAWAGDWQPPASRKRRRSSLDRPDRPPVETPSVGLVADYRLQPALRRRSRRSVAAPTALRHGPFDRRAAGSARRPAGSIRAP